MFRINKIKTEGLDYVSISMEDNINKGNYYSIITGDNGCGKSSLLRKAVNSYIFKSNEMDCEAAHGYWDRPSRVIAICNTRYNKFPAKRFLTTTNGMPYPNYYINPEENNGLDKSMLSVLRDVLRESVLKDKYITNDRVQGIEKAFEMIGIGLDFYIDLSFDDNYLKIVELHKSYGDSGTYNNTSGDSTTYNDFMQWKLSAGISDDDIDKFVSYYNNRLKKITRICRVNYGVGSGYFIIENKSDLNEGLIKAGIAAGFLVPTDLKVRRIDSLKWVSNQDLSSGQQSLLINALIISSLAKKDALICIDEPENSLHPEWQLNYMSFIESLCPSNMGCHFLIATHSPQIISGMKSDDGCVVSLARNKEFISKFRKMKKYSHRGFSYGNHELHSVSSYRRQSADRQLLDVFGSPGFSNESIIHRLFLILTKVTKGLHLNSNDEDYINFISGFIENGKIDEFDPVIVIHNQIKAIRNVRAHGDSKSN